MKLEQGKQSSFFLASLTAKIGHLRNKIGDRKLYTCTYYSNAERLSSCGSHVRGISTNLPLIDLKLNHSTIILLINFEFMMLISGVNFVFLKYIKNLCKIRQQSNKNTHIET